MVVRGVALGDAIVVVAVLEVVATPEVVAAPEVEAESPTSVRGRTPVDVDVGVGMGCVGVVGKLRARVRRVMPAEWLVVLPPPPVVGCRGPLGKVAEGDREGSTHEAVDSRRGTGCIL